MARVPDNQRFLPAKKEKNGAQQDQCYCRDEPSLSNEVNLSHREIFHIFLNIPLFLFESNLQMLWLNFILGSNFISFVFGYCKVW